ncbi:hypothetical protein HDU97_004594 [Phlyctochytrium planicorne]|nr:hypothetical protein HDU97_004594 [Phlyctochytrium planicorne]
MAEEKIDPVPLQDETDSEALEQQQQQQQRIKPIPSPNFVKPFHTTQLLVGDPQLADPKLLYDRVLVDAECTHDGSISHLDKCDKVGWEGFEERYQDPQKMDELEELQVFDPL